MLYCLDQNSTVLLEDEQVICVWRLNHKGVLLIGALLIAPKLVRPRLLSRSDRPRPLS